MKQANKKINTIPKNYTALTPWLITPSSEKMIAFMQEAFNAVEIPNSRITSESGVIIHVVVKIGDAMLMLFDSREGWPISPGYFNLYVDDIEKVNDRAIKSGARSVTNITTLWFGEKVTRIIDPFGNLWWINQRIEEVDFTNPEEVAKRASTPAAIQGIAYIQESLDTAMKTHKEFFKSKD